MATCNKCGYPKAGGWCPCKPAPKIRASGNSNDRQSRQGQSSYGRNSGSGSYGSGTYSFKEATFDGFPALKRFRDGKTEFFYGPAPVNVDDPNHGHAIIKDGKLIYKRRPGQSTPDINIGG